MSKIRVILISCAIVALGESATAQTLVVGAASAHAVNAFSPMRSLGAAVDRLDVGAADRVLNEPMLKEILASGWQPVTYRQNTGGDLGIVIVRPDVQWTGYWLSKRSDYKRGLLCQAKIVRRGSRWGPLGVKQSQALRGKLSANFSQ